MFVKTAEAFVGKVLDQSSFKKTASTKLVQYDPDFLYIVVRGVTANVPNSNHDMFSEAELLREDARIRRPVYASFIGNGVYVNHKADDPLTAKGIILDSRFVRNADDKYVELLLGIDKKKDPIFAQGVERGTINRWSMGASVEFTKCSYCGNVARRTSEFCDHIKSKKGEVIDGKRIYEDCYGVAFTELSAVASPADATALSLAKVAAGCDCRECPKCNAKTVCAKCGQCARHSSHKEGCAGCSRHKEAQRKQAIDFSRCRNCASGECTGCSKGACRCTHTAGSLVEKSATGSHGTVIQLAAMRDDIRKLDRKVEAIMRKKAMPPVTGAPEAPAPGMESGAPMGEKPVDDMGMEEPMGAGGEVADVVRTLADFMDGAVDAEQVVQVLEEARGGDPAMEEEESFDDGMGEAPPPAADMGGAAAPAGHSPMAKTKGDFAKFITAVAKQYKADANKGTKVKEAKQTKKAEEGAKVTNQYPYEKVQKDPAQHHSKPGKGRPASDFEKSKNEYAKMYNITAEFIPSTDKRTAAWQVNEGETPLFVVTGEGAFEELLEEQWNHFASRQYGEDLVASIVDNGLEETMRHVNATAIPNARVVNSKTTLDEQRLMLAAEQKASDLAQEMNSQYRERFLAGLKLAIELQNKNVMDNPIKAAAYEVLADAGVEDVPGLCDKIADSEIVEMQLTAAIAKACEYIEMDPDAFEEVKAHVATMPTTKVAAKLANATSDAERDDIQAEAIRLSMRKRASAGSGMTFVAPGDTGKAGFEDRLSQAVRSGLITGGAPRTPLTYGRPQRAR